MARRPGDGPPRSRSRKRRSPSRGGELAEDGGAEGYHAAILLARLKDDGALPLLRARIDGEPRAKRLSGWFALVARMGTKAALALLREYAEGEDRVRADAARDALERAGDQR